MYQALYRKYRPTSFSDCLGQTPVTETLKNAVESRHFSHAYLFCGTRGTGKTTCAKILAAAVNCEHPVNGSPCMECDACKAILSGCTDIVEMDAASNNGVNDIRLLKEQISFLPTFLKYRVYIIDEVHMLSDSAFNALLKTLEEPPEHIIFILATTEAHKIPATILSRCQRYDFKRIDTDIIKGRVLEVSEKENIKITDEAANLIALLADGGMRDALSLLDQCAGCSENITEKAVVEICGLADNELKNKFIESVINKTAEGAIEVINSASNSGINLEKFCSDIISYYRDMMIIKTVKEPKKLILSSNEQFLTEKENAKAFSLEEIMSSLELLGRTKENMSSFNRKSEMELCAIKISLRDFDSISALKKRIEILENTLKNKDFNFLNQSTESKEIKVNKEVKENKTQETKEPYHDTFNFNKEEIKAPEKTVIQSTDENKKNTFTAASEPVNNNSKVTEWPEILERVKAYNMPIFGVLYNTTAYFSNNRILIKGTPNSFKDMVNNNAKNREDIKNAIKDVLGKAYNIGPYKENPEPQKAAEASNTSETLGTPDISDTPDTLNDNGTDDPLMLFAKKLQ